MLPVGNNPKKQHKNTGVGKKLKKNITMKKLLLLTMLIVGLNLTAQENHFGIKLNIGQNTFAYKNVEGSQYSTGKIGLGIGFMGEFMINDQFAIAPEINYTMAGDNYEGEESGIKFKSTIYLSYLKIPLLARYYINENFSIEAGPYLGMLLTADRDYSITYDGNTDRDSKSIKDVFNDTDFGLNFGLGYKMENGLFINARYSYGLSIINVLEDSNDKQEVRNAAINIGIGYFFK